LCAKNQKERGRGSGAILLYQKKVITELVGEGGETRVRHSKMGEKKKKNEALIWPTKGSLYGLLRPLQIEGGPDGRKGDKKSCQGGGAGSIGILKGSLKRWENISFS